MSRFKGSRSKHRSNELGLIEKLQSLQGTESISCSMICLSLRMMELWSPATSTYHLQLTLQNIQAGETLRANTSLLNKVRALLARKNSLSAKEYLLLLAYPSGAMVTTQKCSHLLPTLPDSACTRVILRRGASIISIGTLKKNFGGSN